MSVVETPRDEKAGYCGNCRRGDHALCMSAACTCPDMRKHRNRPGFASVDKPVAPRPVAEPERPLRVVQDGLDKPVWCDPPVSRRGRVGVDWVTLTAPCKERPGEWLRVRKLAAPTSASSQRSKARKALGAGWEVRAARVDAGSAVWVRWIGAS